ncbi:MAG: hypothetical protein AAF682_16485 [Planctomycetota bacterium]
MPSFLFCTSYITDRSPFARWTRWLDFYDARRERLGVDRLVLIDDGTPSERLPGELTIVSADRPLPPALPDGPVMFRFAENLGRTSLRGFPGWWRSFTFAAAVAERYGYERILHCESDAFVLSDRMLADLGERRRGWTAFWCPLFRMPETAIQVLAGDGARRLARLHRYGERLWLQSDPLVRLGVQRMRMARAGYGPRELLGLAGALLMPRLAESVLPFDEVCRRFVGDRYSERGTPPPADADYVCQTPLDAVLPGVGAVSLDA